jgi:hypothetical protein
MEELKVLIKEEIRYFNGCTIKSYEMVSGNQELELFMVESQNNRKIMTTLRGLSITEVKTYNNPARKKIESVLPLIDEKPKEAYKQLLSIHQKFGREVTC